MADRIDPRDVETALAKLEDGFVFERFVADFLASLIGVEFVPVAGVHDRGVDGFADVFKGQGGSARTLYQFSIRTDVRTKIFETLQRLREAKVEGGRLIYVTNQQVKSELEIEDAAWEQFEISVSIYDLRWLSAHVNDSPGAVKAYQALIDQHFSQYKRPGTVLRYGEYVNDPRVYVFLRQLWDERRADDSLNDVLLDGLILFSLEDTDPDEERILTREQLRVKIGQYLGPSAKSLLDRLDRRLEALCDRPRQVMWHSALAGYVLPYETRREIKQRNLRDQALLDSFRSASIQRLRRYEAPDPDRAFSVLESLLESLFREIGTEFSNFILYGDAESVVQKRLDGLVAAAVTQSDYRGSDRAGLQRSLVLTIRDAIYHGGSTESDYLGFLARTYLMLFLLDFDPKVDRFFRDLATQLSIYVDSSIIIPAMSEYYLDQRNQRFGGLLRGARKAGVRLFVNKSMVSEIVSHLYNALRDYNESFRGRERIFDQEEQILYVDEIMIRAYLYARNRRQISPFDEYVRAFVSPEALADGTADEELIEWLKAEFGVEYREDASLNVPLPQDEVQAIASEVERLRAAGSGARIRALNDARMALLIYRLREQKNEAGDGGIFGYRTWWLSTDTRTGRAIKSLYPDKYPKTCYLRADFLYDFLALRGGSDGVPFESMFPSITGVSLSYFLDSDVGHVTRRYLREHGRLEGQDGRIRAAIRRHAELLKTDPSRAGAHQLRSFFDEELQLLERGQ